MRWHARKGERARPVREVILAALLIVTIGVLAARVPGFTSRDNLLLLTTDRLHIGLLVIGMTFVILTAGIDLSVGSMLALAGLAFGLTAQRTGGNLWLAIPCGLLVGVAAGAVNGVLVAGARVPALIVTLATLSVYRGLAAGLGGDASLGGFGDSFVGLKNELLLGIPLPAWLLVALLVATGLYLSRAAGGRAIYALGANEPASRLAGIPVRKIKFRVYAFSGLLSGLAALTYCMLNETFKSDVGKGYELEAITVVVLGGVSVAGGEGSMLGTALALALVTIGLNGMDLSDIQRERQSMVVALVLVAALWIDSRLRRRG